jgi:hypothetical protein
MDEQAENTIEEFIARWLWCAHIHAAIGSRLYS